MYKFLRWMAVGLLLAGAVPLSHAGIITFDSRSLFDAAHPGLLLEDFEEAVVAAGGFKETGDPEAAIIIRKGPDNQPVPMRVNLKNALTGETPDALVQLRPYDVVYIPKTWIAGANKFVREYVQDLLLFRGVSLGFSYELHAEPTETKLVP